MEEFEGFMSFKHNGQIHCVTKFFLKRWRWKEFRGIVFLEKMLVGLPEAWALACDFLK